MVEGPFGVMDKHIELLTEKTYKLMKKNYFAIAMVAMSLSVVSCGDDPVEVTIPEGTTEVTIDEDKLDVNAGNLTNWTQYAVQVANLLTSDATTLRDSWKVSYKDGEAFAETFKNPSSANASYKSYSACLQEIIEGCADIANEVGTAKIGEPRDLWEQGQYTEAVYAVESWYSFHSIDDYANNIRSIRNAFNGSTNGTEASNSIASYLKSKNASLYNDVKSAVSNAIRAIEGMAAPFRSHIGNASVLVAQEACAELESILSNKLKGVMMEADEADLKPIVVNYVDNVVLPTYDELVRLNTALNTAVRNLANNPSQKTFEAAANAWLEARAPWETSEAFLFGPVGDLGLDPNMDSWPLDAAALANILDNGDFKDLVWDGEFDEDDETIAAAQNVRGFHTLEFLLFKNGVPRTIHN